MLAVSSSRGTVHIFSIIEAAKLTKDMQIASQEQGYGGANHGSKVRMAGQSDSYSSKIKKRWYDGFLSNMKQTKNDENESKPLIIRSVAKIKCKKPITPNIVAMLPIPSACKALTSSGGNHGENIIVAICFGDGKLLVYTIHKHNLTGLKYRPRQILADDIMFENDSAIQS